MSKPLVRLIFAGVLAMICVSQTAKADLTPQFVSSTSGAGGTTVFRYNILLSNGSSINNGGVNDFVTFYDFAGYVANSASIISSMGTWAKTEQLLGLNPIGFAPAFDSPTLMNISFGYSTGGQVSGPATVLVVDLTSVLPQAPGVFTAYSGQSTNVQNSTLQGNFGSVIGPNAVPEPGTFILLGVGGVLCTLYARRVRHARVA